MACGKRKHDEANQCSAKDAPIICLNCGGNHTPTSYKCPKLILHNQIKALAITKNISLFKAKVAIRNSLGTNVNDSKLDFKNFPLLPTRRPSSGTCTPDIASHAFSNRFSLLDVDSTGDSSPNISDSINLQQSYAEAVSHRNSTPLSRRQSNTIPRPHNRAAPRNDLPLIRIKPSIKLTRDGAKILVQIYPGSRIQARPPHNYTTIASAKRIFLFF